MGDALANRELIQDLRPNAWGRMAVPRRVSAPAGNRVPTAFLLSDRRPAPMEKAVNWVTCT